MIKKMYVKKPNVKKSAVLGGNPSRLKSKFIRFKKSDDGVAAIEFAFIGPVFFALIFAIIDVAVYFMLERATEAGTDFVARKIKTSQITTGTTPQQLRDELCDAPTMALFDCGTIHADVKVIGRFAAPDGLPRNKNGSINSSGFGVNIGNSSQIHLVRVYVPWPSLLPWGNMFSFFSTRPDVKVDDQRVIVAATAFLVE